MCSKFYSFFSAVIWFEQCPYFSNCFPQTWTQSLLLLQQKNDVVTHRCSSGINRIPSFKITDKEKPSNTMKLCRSRRCNNIRMVHRFFNQVVKNQVAEEQNTWAHLQPTSSIPSSWKAGHHDNQIGQLSACLECTLHDNAKYLELKDSWRRP